MGEAKHRGIRLDEDNWQWLNGLPGRTLNEALTALRNTERSEAINTAAVNQSVDSEKFQKLYERVNRMEIMVEELLELARSEPQRSTNAIVTANQRDEPISDNRPKNAFCKHCGERFAGSRFATICSSCKSQGHTNEPAECPKCTEASSL